MPRERLVTDLKHLLLRINLPHAQHGALSLPEYECVLSEELAPGRFKLQKPPVFSEEVSVFDLVKAGSDPLTLAPVLECVEGRSGYHLARVKPNVESKENVEAAVFALQVLESDGCVTAHNEEFGTIAIGIPPNGIVAIRLILSAEEEGVWVCGDRDRSILFRFLENKGAVDWS